MSLGAPAGKHWATEEWGQSGNKRRAAAGINRRQTVKVMADNKATNKLLSDLNSREYCTFSGFCLSHIQLFK